ncbi:MAG: RING-HC finger protein [Candidatus Omnitrophica bacterium]|nr:RING-HC finger protein [Candidatus Omnitrophota bacterium]
MNRKKEEIIRLEEELLRKKEELNTIIKRDERRIKREMSESMQIEQVNSIVNSIRNLFIIDDDDELCTICYTNFSNITFYPCGHDNCCESCYMRLENRRCPYCRTPIDSTDSFRFRIGNNINHDNNINNIVDEFEFEVVDEIEDEIEVVDEVNININNNINMYNSIIFNHYQNQ